MPRLEGEGEELLVVVHMLFGDWVVMDAYCYASVFVWLVAAVGVYCFQNCGVVFGLLELQSFEDLARGLLVVLRGGCELFLWFFLWLFFGFLLVFLHGLEFRHV